MMSERDRLRSLAARSSQEAKDSGSLTEIVRMTKSYHRCDRSTIRGAMDPGPEGAARVGYSRTPSLSACIRNAFSKAGNGYSFRRSIAQM